MPDHPSRVPASTPPSDPSEILRHLTEFPSGALRPDSEQILARLTAAAVTGVPGAEYAGLTSSGRGRLVSRAPSHPRVNDVDHLQVVFDEGPCVDAITTGASTTTLVEDFATDTRWPRFGPAAADVGVRSLLSVALAFGRTRHGTLNLYSSSPHAFDTTSQAIAAALATHAPVAISGTETVDELHRALATRNAVGQATGILIQRFGIDPEQAFALLVQLSQDTGTELADIARQVLDDTIDAVTSRDRLYGATSPHRSHRYIL